MNTPGMPENVVLSPEGRICHMNLYVPALNLNKKMTYSATLLLPKATTNLGDIQKAVNAAIQKGVKDKWKGYMPPNLQLPVCDGDAYAAQKPEKRQAYVGQWYINMKQNPDFGQPVILNEQRVRSANPQEVQGGDYVVVVLEFVPYDNLQRGVAAIPKVVRKTRTGEHFGGGISEADALALVGGEIDPAVAEVLAPTPPGNLSGLF